MDTDDTQVGRILSRREVLALLGLAGAGAMTGRVAAQSHASPRSSVWVPACVVTPAQTEGPYFIDEKLNRADIRPDPATGKSSDGTPLDLAIRVFRVANGACTPLSGAMVDVWQCDALGVYSGVRDINGFFNTAGQKFLRGYQLTDSSGVAKFSTVYPGWYQGRCVHIHFKVRSNEGGRNVEFTSQLYFDDAVSDKVFASAPYNTKSGRRTTNERDGIFRQGGRQLMLDVTGQGNRYTGTFDIGLAQ